MHPGLDDKMAATKLARQFGRQAFGENPASDHSARPAYRDRMAVEPDQRLADFLRTNNPDTVLKVVGAPFERAPLEENAFDLGVSATAFHWLDEDSALVKIARLLRPGVWRAAVWNVFGDDSRPDPFHEATKELLDAPASPSAGERGVPFGLDDVARLAALKRTGAFDVVESRSSQWSIARADFADRVVRNMTTSLYVARRKG